MKGYFTIFNEPDEATVIRRFFNEIRNFVPNIIVTYNGDNFDWPFLEQRAAYHNINTFDVSKVAKFLRFEHC
jgi:DNA polymerase epsilon subunit 1